MPDAAGFTEETVRYSREPPRLRIESAWTEPVSAWTPATMRAALAEHDSGRFYTSAAYADWCWRDAEYSGAMRTRVDALASRSALPFTVEAGEGDGRLRESIRKRVDQLWWTSIPESTTAAILIDAIPMRCAIGRLRWLTREDEWIPFLHPLPIHGLEFVDEGDGRGQRPIYNTADGERLEVTPGDGTWFLYLPCGPRSWLRGALRSCAEPVLSRAYTSRDWNRWCEKHGLPMLKVKEPHFAGDDVEGALGSGGTGTATVYGAIRTGLAGGAVLRLPQGADKDTPGWDAEWMELVGQSYQGFSAHLDKKAGEIRTSVLGRNETGAKGGDGELASERLRIEGLSSDAETLSTALRDQVWKPYVAFNYGARHIELAPWGRWNTRPPTDLASRAKTLDTAADAMTKLKALGAALAPIMAEFQIAAVESGAGGEPVAPEPPPQPEPTPEPLPEPEPQKEAA